ncbi:MAG: archaeosortase/exosortase family protein [Candidatus Aenigmarchaeota archaeon]|nr:archaeosortase/exosortase family protein [Candidatus Aenigmarchaeota archaeon]
MKVRLDQTQKRLLETLLFLIKILVFSIPLYVIMQLQNILLPLQEIVSANVVSLLQLFGFSAYRSGFLIAADGIAFIVSEDCTGWKSMLLLAALVCAVPRIAWKRRFAGIAAGLMVIYLGNLARIMVVVLVWKAYGIGTANLIHDIFWQFGLIALVLLTWVAWLVWAGKIRCSLCACKTMLIKRPRKLIKPRRRETRSKSPKRTGKR